MRFKIRLTNSPPDRGEVLGQGPVVELLAGGVAVREPLVRAAVAVHVEEIPGKARRTGL